MQFKTSKFLFIDFTLDSSEAVMFSKGGKHSLNINPSLFDDDFDKIEISVQMERNQQGRFDFITNSAAEAIARRENES